MLFGDIGPLNPLAYLPLARPNGTGYLFPVRAGGIWALRPQMPGVHGRARRVALSAALHKSCDDLQRPKGTHNTNSN